MGDDAHPRPRLGTSLGTSLCDRCGLVVDKNHNLWIKNKGVTTRYGHSRRRRSQGQDRACRGLALSTAQPGTRTEQVAQNHEAQSGTARPAMTLWQSSAERETATRRRSKRRGSPTPAHDHPGGSQRPRLQRGAPADSPGDGSAVTRKAVEPMHTNAATTSVRISPRARAIPRSLSRTPSSRAAGGAFRSAREVRGRTRGARTPSGRPRRAGCVIRPVGAVRGRRRPGPVRWPQPFLGRTAPSANRTSTSAFIVASSCASNACSTLAVLSHS